MRPLAMYVPEPGRGSSIPIDLFTAFALTSQSRSGGQVDEWCQVDFKGCKIAYPSGLGGDKEVMEVLSKVVDHGDMYSSYAATPKRKSCEVVDLGAESDHVSITTSELKNECPPDQNQMEMQVHNGDRGNEILCLQQSPAIGTAGEERVRQVFHE
ncbi:hypothetical protein Tco_0489692 [Tanacetum coccineum]